MTPMRMPAVEHAVPDIEPVGIRLLRAALTVLVLAGPLAFAASSAGAAAVRVARLDERAFNSVALAAENQVRERLQAAGHHEALRFAFHRQQAFVAGESGAAWQVTSLAWSPERGGPSRCALVAARPAAANRPTVPQTFDALVGGEEAWDCDGAPALKFVPGELPGHWRVIALYTFRAPGGSHFPWPLVVSCPASAVPGECSVDEAGTQRLHRAVEQGTRIDTLSQAQQLLVATPARR